MSTDREWIRTRSRLAARQPSDTVDAETSLRTRPSRLARVLTPHVLREVARRAGNRIARRFAQEDAFVAPEHVERAIDSQAGSGSAMDHATRQSMEGAFGTDLSGVRIHNDSQADTLSAELSARAFTRGNDIFFSAGEYNPATGDGQRLLAHELTHVTQQEDGAKLDVGAANDPAEFEADAIADQVVQRLASRAPDTGGDAVQRQAEDEEEEEAVQTVRRQEEEVLEDA